MKERPNRLHPIYYIAFLFLIISCSKDQDLEFEDGFKPTTNTVPTQDFMWKAMNIWYFWQEEVENLNDDRFNSAQSYTDFLLSEEDPALFFENQLLFSEDRFSYYNEDYRVLTQALSGISKSNGLEFGLVRKINSEAIFGYVRYIIPNSDAATKNIKRGDFFTGVNGQTLTINNYISLLFGDQDTYTLNMADFVNNDVVQNDQEITLTKQEALAENPVFISKAFEINGIQIGYLMYNQFTNEYDDDLYTAISSLKSAGITEFIVDLRYNPGGSVNTTRLLASMIYGTNTKNLFLKKKYNNKIQNQLSDSQLEVHFADKVGDKTINSLALDKVYVLTTASSASASELLINSLEPYMDVIHIGDVTRGKNEFSTTLVDDRENSYLYTPSRTDKINDNNQWAIQPLLGRNENADGFSDYTSGLVPDIELKEDLRNLGILGDQNEPLLARAIQEITGATGKRDFTVYYPVEILSSSKQFGPFKDKMIDDTHGNEPLPILNDINQ